MSQIRNLLLITIFFAMGCTTVTSGKVFKSDEAVTLRFGGQPGSETETRYVNSSRMLTYSDQELLKDRRESVDFTVVTKVKARDEAQKTISVTSTTVAKDGVVELHDLAFPEKDEAIDFVIKETGEVLRAGRFPPQSIFFVPPMPIPDKPVQVGDTWTMEHVWRSAREGIPLMLEVVAILKNIVSCDEGAICADVEISGHVKLVVRPTETNARFSGKIWGRMLFSTKRGDILWTQTRTREDMVHSGGRVKVSSCMISQMKTAKSPSFAADCEPDDEKIATIPKF